jgi:hypothetical protein
MVLLVILFAIILVLLFYRRVPLAPVRAYDNNIYMVMDGNKEAANKLASLRGKLLQLIDDLQYTDELKLEDKKRLKSRFKALLSENSPGGWHTSYTVNKGEHIYMCIRPDRAASEFEDDNVIMFVALHELAHVMSKAIGHKRDFKRNFRMLLKHAEKRGYYKYHPYHIKPKKYCGTVISALP